MSLGLIGKKLGMTQVYTADGNAVAVTVIAVAGNQVLQIKKASEKDGYTAVQVGFDDQKEKRVNKAQLGHFKRWGAAAPKRKIQEFRVASDDQLPAEGTVLGADLFAAGVVLWELLAGERLFAPDDPTNTVARRIRSDVMVRPSERRPAHGGPIPRVLEDILLRALRCAPEERFHSALEVEFQPDHLRAQPRQLLDVHAHAAAVLQHLPADALTRGLFDHFQAALLPRSPHIGRFSAQGGFFEVAISHAGYYTGLDSFQRWSSSSERSEERIETTSLGK